MTCRDETIYWDFDFNLRKTETARRPDLVLEHLDEKKITIGVMASMKHATKNFESTSRWHSRLEKEDQASE